MDTKGTLGQRVEAIPVCSLLLIIQIQKEHDCGGKDPLSICRHCFGMKVDIPGSNGNINS